MLMLVVTACQTRQLEAIVVDASSKLQLMAGQTAYGGIMEDWFQIRNQCLIHVGVAPQLCGFVMKNNLRFEQFRLGEYTGPAEMRPFFPDFHIHQ